ncbi:unnamed protein product, partial [Sphacelaria rigidula]
LPLRHYSKDWKAWEAPHHADPRLLPPLFPRCLSVPQYTMVDSSEPPRGCQHPPFAPSSAPTQPRSSVRLSPSQDISAMSALQNLCRRNLRVPQLPPSAASPLLPRPIW